MNSMAPFLEKKKNIITDTYHPGQAGVIFLLFKVSASTCEAKSKACVRGGRKIEKLSSSSSDLPSAFASRVSVSQETWPVL